MAVALGVKCWLNRRPHRVANCQIGARFPDWGQAACWRTSDSGTALRCSIVLRDAVVADGLCDRPPMPSCALARNWSRLPGGQLRGDKTSHLAGGLQGETTSATSVETSSERGQCGGRHDPANYDGVPAKHLHRDRARAANRGNSVLSARSKLDRCTVEQLNPQHRDVPDGAPGAQAAPPANQADMPGPVGPSRHGWEVGFKQGDQATRATPRLALTTFFLTAWASLIGAAGRGPARAWPPRTCL